MYGKGIWKLFRKCSQRCGDCRRIQYFKKYVVPGAFIFAAILFNSVYSHQPFETGKIQGTILYRDLNSKALKN